VSLGLEELTDGYQTDVVRCRGLYLSNRRKTNEGDTSISRLLHIKASPGATRFSGGFQELSAVTRKLGF